jgi:PBP1b-binding outer membrane lipoprotein LpoB
MTNRTVWLGLVALALLAACSKQAPQPAPVADQEPTPAAAVQPQPAPTYDSAKVAAMATSMLVMIDDAPQCQTFRDQLQAIANAPAGTPPSVAPSAIVAQANEAGCAKKYGK